MAGKGSVSPELRTRIMAAAGRLCYEPNLAARALASRHGGLVAVAVSRPDDAVVVRTAAAVLCGLDGHGYDVLVPSETRARDLDIGRLAKRGAEAVMLIGRAPLVAERAALSKHRLAWVSVADVEGENAGCVDIGRARALELACRYLREVGHQRLGVLAPPELTVEPLVNRLMDEGTAAVACTRLALPGDPLAIGDALGSLLEAPGPPTAVVCGDDLTALAVTRECSLRGISVPRDLAVVGFGDEPFARCSRPALTTVRPAYAELGRQAAEAVLDVLAGRSWVAHTPAHKLVIRETTERPGNPRSSTWNG